MTGFLSETCIVPDNFFAKPSMFTPDPEAPLNARIQNEIACLHQIAETWGTDQAQEHMALVRAKCFKLAYMAGANSGGLPRSQLAHGHNAEWARLVFIRVAPKIEALWSALRMKRESGQPMDIRTVGEIACAIMRNMEE